MLLVATESKQVVEMMYVVPVRLSELAIIADQARYAPLVPTCWALILVQRASSQQQLILSSSGYDNYGGTLLAISFELAI